MVCKIKNVLWNNLQALIISFKVNVGYINIVKVCRKVKSNNFVISLKKKDRKKLNSAIF